MSGVEVIPVKNHLFQDLKITDIKKQIIERINKFPDLQKYKSDVEFLLLICNMVEHLVSKKDKISKKQLVIEIFNQVFPLNENEVRALEQNIDFLWNNKKIKKQSYYRLFKTGVFEWIKRKFL